MFDHIVALENALDRQLPRPRLRGKPPKALIAAAREWSDAIWRAAESVGPFVMTSPALERGLGLAHRPVFICGVHRSGTTLVRDLLDGHPALSVLPSEGTFYTNHRRHIERLGRLAARQFLGGEWCRRLANPINQPPYWSIGRSTSVESMSVAFLRAFLAWWSALEARVSTRQSAWPLVAVALGYTSYATELTISSEVERWVEKTPMNERFLADLWTDFPGARVVHVVRDPVAVVTSRKAMEEHSTGAFRQMRQVLGDLAESYRIASEHSARGDIDRYTVVRFEDLITDTDQTMRRLAQFLEVTTLPILFQPTVAGRPSMNNSSFDADRSIGTIVTSRTASRNDSLSNQERLRIAVVVGDAAAAIGYAVPA
jgi:hypothetical protein